MIVGSQDNWFNRFDKTMYQIRGRHAARAELTPFVGQDSLHMLEAISDDPEADAATHAQEVGQVAVRDNWQGQIGTLESQLSDANTRATQLNDLVQQLKTQVAQDTATIQQLQAPPAPTQPPQTPNPNTITITKDGLWAKIKSLLTNLGF